MRKRMQKECITVVPWYDRAGFAEMRPKWAEAGLGYDYDRWRGQATRAIEIMQHAGRPVEIVMVRPDAYRNWLATHAHADSRVARQRFVQELAAG